MLTGSRHSRDYRFPTFTRHVLLTGDELTLLGAIALLPSLAFAQASITGVVRDSSGGVMPGVVVEASSPALIERVRSVVSDGTGQYRIVDLRPGTYTVTFTLPGFNTLVLANGVPRRISRPLRTKVTQLAGASFASI